MSLIDATRCENGADSAISLHCTTYKGQLQVWQQPAAVHAEQQQQALHGGNLFPALEDNMQPQPDACIQKGISCMATRLHAGLPQRMLLTALLLSFACRNQ